MIRLQEALSRLIWVFRRRSLDRDFAEEFATHIDLLTEQNERRGLPRHEARRQAILQMGGLNATKDLHRDARGLPQFERFLEMFLAAVRDMVHAVHSLAKARAFTFVCVTSLGIGMGTVIGISILIRTFGPPAGFNPDGLVELVVTPLGKLKELVGGLPIPTWSYPDFSDVRAADTGMAITGWTTGESVARVRSGGTARVPTMYVTANYFTTMGVALARGSGFEAAVDKDRAAAPVVIISHDFWANHLGSDPDILGKTVTLNRIPHVVVGIVPDGFHTHVDSDIAWVNLWIPLLQHPRLRADGSLRFNRNIDWIRLHGRLGPGVSIERANAAVSAIMSGLAQRYPASNEFRAASVEPYLAMGARRRGDFAELRAMFLGMAGIVLLVVCLNISGMVLVRSAMRERELSIRQAIGAGRGHLIRYLLSEAIVLAVLSGSLASAVLLGVPALIWWWAGQPLPPAMTPDGTLIAMCVVLCAITSLMFGLMPAVRFSRPSVVSALKDDVGGGARRVGRVHRLAAAVQVGIAVPFLVVGGVLLDHVRTAATAELGFEPKGLLAAPLDLAGSAETDERAMFLLRTARENLAQTTAVTSVGVADGLPLDFQSRVIRVFRQDQTPPAFVRPTRVDEGYLRTMGIRLVRGRGFTPEDRAGAELVAVITEPLAVRLFPNSDALGQRLTFALEDKTTKVVTVVGVIADLVGSQMANPREQMLLPLAQHRSMSVFLIARTAEGIGSRAGPAAFRNALREFNPDFDTASIVTGEGIVRRSTRDLIIQSAHAGVGGVVALTLAALGVYGVIGFMLATRTREMAVRIALGASHGRVLRTILTDVVKLTAPGVALGLIVAIAYVRSSYLSWYSLGAVEPLVYMVAAGIAVFVALLASLPAARRAASVEPMAAIRSE